MTNRTPRTWLITGADKGLGYSTAKAALEQGDRVVVTVLAADGSHALAAEFPDRLRAFHLDARDHHRFDEVVERAAAAFGSIDVLVNNAGYGLLAVAEATPAEKYRAMFEINFFGLAEMTRAVLPLMRRQRSGHIVNLSSKAGFGASAGFAFYSASKFAVEGYSEALAMEVRHLGIRVTIIEPGGFRSDFAGASLVSAQINDNDYASISAMIKDYAAQRHGKQPSDPAKFGPAVCRLVDAEDPPLRLPLGDDSLEFIRDDLRTIGAELDRWEALSRSTRVDA
ncbi:short-chain dehydrogenase [Burkholderia lata]|uniref:oxidoreductase n=1 Tax=Burkholderia lata (strain ATCC 17760 / DSM 23089 / LMG 22485 / NCIMB 9086 / R18194 / 383) TaxID=482957 RepID=UPI001453931C|nr:oxidoreductase [Burkholderia lata]VWB18480.1 short-chain dehydrogenase [Burkholderia lata]